MSKIINSIIVILFIVLAVSTIVFLRNGRSIVQIVKREIAPKEVSVDIITDYRGLGYTGQRKIVSDSDGNFYLAYRKDVSGYSEIHVARVFWGRSGKLEVAGTNESIALVGKAEQRVPSIAADSKRVIHVVWYGSDGQNNQAGGNRQIKYSRSIDQGQSWSGWRDISFVSGYKTGEEFWQEHPSITAGRDGNLYVIWEGKDEKNGNQQIKFSKSINGGNVWSNWKNIRTSASATQSRPTLVEDLSGKLHLFMYSSLGTANNIQQIQHAFSSDKGETWSSWQTISDPGFDARHVSAAVDPRGAIHVVWRSQVAPNTPSRIIYRSLEGNRWSGSRVVSKSSRWQFFPSVGTDSAESVFVSWFEGDNASGFPQDDPRGGYGNIAVMKSGTFQSPAVLSDQGNILYPGVPQSLDSIQSVPIIYTQKLDNNKFEIRMKLWTDQDRPSRIINAIIQSFRRSDER